MLRLRKIGGQVVVATLLAALEPLSTYGYAMNHPKATAAVVLGTGLAAALPWMMQRNGGYNAVREQVLKRVRGR